MLIIITTYILTTRYIWETVPILGDFFFFRNKDFVLTWIIFKVSIEFVTILFLFSFGFLAPKACGILSPLSEVELAQPALEEVLTTGPPGRSLLS